MVDDGSSSVTNTGDDGVQQILADEFLGGLNFLPPEDEGPPDFAFVLMRRGSGTDATWSFRSSSPPNMHELLGAMEVQAKILRNRLVSDWDRD